MSRKKKGEPVHGWLILDKPEGVTSTQAVGACRRIYNAQKCGHGGTLDKFIGDGVMATFGTPDAQPDDETRALRCALDMVRSVEDWNRGRRTRGLPAVRIAVGVHVGPVLMGAIGSRNRRCKCCLQ
jgi:class 3 adenylate cyclase